jgi:hypothetical protein
MSEGGGHWISWVLLSEIGALAVLSSVFTLVNKDVESKRRIWSLGNIVGGVLWTGFVWSIHPTLGLLMMPMAALIALFNLRTTKFCGACSATLIQQTLRSDPTHCPKCGSRLES